MSQKKNKKKHHSGRNKSELDLFIKAIKNIDCESTTNQQYINKTINNSIIETEDVNANEPRQKSRSRRLCHHIKENWPSYVITIILSFISFMLFTLYPKVILSESNTLANSNEIEKINTNISDLKKDLEREQRKQDLEIASLKERVIMIYDYMIKNKEIKEDTGKK